MSVPVELDRARRRGLWFVGVLNLGMIPVPPLVAWAVGNPVWLAAGLTAALGLLGIVVRNGGGSQARAGSALALVGQAMLLTAALSGHPWQIDSHMVYFAMLAALVILLDLTALIAAAAAIVVQHLGMTLLLPHLVYPSADLVPNLVRSVLHGAIVGVELLALIHLVRGQVAQMRRSADEALALSVALDTSRSAEERISAAQAELGGVVDELRIALERLATGDLGAILPAAFPDRFETLRRDWNAAISALGGAMSDVQATTNSIRADTGSIAASAQRLSARTEAQAHALSQVAQRIEAIDTAMAGSAEEARATRTAADATTAEAEAGMTVVDGAIDAMVRIEDSSDRIRNIVAVIDDLSVQTNLLALNAGVEAARAGSAGLGFAVVASEVRTLAQRSSEAAKQIAELIADSANHVQTGANLVRNAGDTLRGMVAAVRQVSERMQAMAGEAGRNAERMADLRHTVSELDVMTQQNAAMFEETSAATSALTGATDDLHRILSRFDHAGTDQAPKGKAALADGGRRRLRSA